MLSNYYKTAVRSIARSPFYAALNVAGLALGIAFTLVIGIFCFSELRVNKQLRAAGRQYILSSDWKDPNMGYPLATLGALPRALRENYPQLVADFYRFDGVWAVVSANDKHFREGLQIGDSTLLPMYGFSLLQGDKATALTDPGSVVITAEKAIKFFGTKEAVGRVLTIDNFSGGKRDFRVTGVMADPPRNSVTRLNAANDNGIFISTANLPWFGRNMEWSNPHIAGYIELQPGVGVAALKGPIEQLVRANASPTIAANLRVVPQLLSTYYRRSDGGAVQKMVTILMFIAVFILGMAVINFVNLAISRATLRMKEIGIRKVLGGLRGQLRLQFLAESMLLTLAATTLAILGYPLLSPLFAPILGRELPSLWTLPISVWGGIVLFTGMTGLLTGFYPALRLASLSSMEALKGKAGKVKENRLFRKGLIGFQLGTAIVVFVGAIIVSQQIRLFFSDRLGYNKDYILSSQLPRDWSPAGVRHMETIRNVFSRMRGVREVSLSFEIPDGMNSGGLSAYRDGADSSHGVVAQALVTDAHYASTYEIPLAAGVYFHAAGETDAGDSVRLVINETAARAFGWRDPRQAVGQRLRLYSPRSDAQVISGVVKDFYFDGMGNAIQPAVICPVKQMNIYRFLSFKLDPGVTPGQLEKEWAKLMPGAPFEYRFMDESLQSLYAGELRLRKAASTATGVAIVIVLLGVIGLVANSVRLRMREIGIRKVVGASVPGIIRLFIREYLSVLGIAALAGGAVAGWIMQRWLDEYVTRISITGWPFLIATGGLGLVIVLLIAGQTVSAAMANPIRSLKES
ncbi:ABC transporter permease [Puia sp.]|jgi:ABC-type antimicrobial peptide transport system permease subunit|uniref:ABC transporter permease n=1 Tax=Puia sp. TaxID=2045100 RepID=UPI002F413C76